MVMVMVGMRSVGRVVVVLVAVVVAAVELSGAVTAASVPASAVRAGVGPRYGRRLHRVGGASLAAARAQASTVVSFALDALNKARGDGSGACGCASQNVLLSGDPHFPAPRERCPADCSGHGACRPAPDGCACDPGYGGPACSLTVQPASATGKGKGASGGAASLITIVAMPGDKGKCAASVEAAMKALPPGWGGVQVVTAARPKPGVAKAKKKAKLKKGDKVEYGPEFWGGVLRAALRRVSTPYAVVLTGDTTVSDGVTAASVVTAMQTSGLVIAGGLVERSDGGPLESTCAAVKVRNYTVSTEGASWFDHWGGCQVCDHTSDSFVVDVHRFMGVSQNALEARVGTLEMYMRALRRADVAVGTCPGAIQFRELPPCSTALTLPADRLSIAARAFSTTHLVSHWNLHDGTSVSFCGFGRKKGKENKVQGRCRYDRQHADLDIFLKHFTALGVTNYALTEGCMLSALKFRRIMPWDYDIDIFAFVDGWAEVKQMVNPAKFKAALKRDGMHWSFARAGGSAIVFTARIKVDIDTYIIVLNEDSSFQANSKIVKAVFPPFDTAKLLPKGGDVSLQQDYHINWRNIALPQPGDEALHPHVKDLQWHAPTADIWFHGHWVGIRRYNFPNLQHKYGAAPSLLHVTRAMGKGVAQMFGGNYGEKALTYFSKYCPNPNDPGCLDGWVWFQDWYNWVPTPKTMPTNKK